MSLLQEDALQADDASAHGEDLAKGSGHFFIAVTFSLVILCMGIWIFYMAAHKPPVAAGEITHVYVYPVHTISAPHDAAGVALAKQQFDQVLVFALVRVRNQSDDPIVLHDMSSNINFADGLHSSLGVTATDYERIFVAYPQLKGVHGKTLVRDTVIKPGEVLDGQVVTAYHVNQAEWEARRDMNITLDIQMHPNLVLLPAAGVVTELK